MPWRNPEAPQWPPVRNPFEIGAGLFYLAIGFFGVLGLTSPSVQRVLPPELLGVWLTGALLSGLSVAVAAAVVHKDFATSMLLEKVGLLGIFLFSIYLLALYVVAGSSNITAYLLLTFLVGSSGWRWWQVRKWIKWAQSADKVVVSGPITFAKGGTDA